MFRKPRSMSETAAASPLTPAPIIAIFESRNGFMRPRSPMRRSIPTLDFDQPKLQKKKPSFYVRVYEIVEQIPKGKVTTYGAIAEVLGMKGSSRMVGQALGALK